MFLVANFGDGVTIPGHIVFDAIGDTAQGVGVVSFGFVEVFSGGFFDDGARVFVQGFHETVVIVAGWCHATIRGVGAVDGLIPDSGTSVFGDDGVVYAGTFPALGGDENVSYL